MSIKKNRRLLKSVAEALDYFRIVPRIILVAYAYVMFDIIQWFMLLETPDTEQSLLVITVIGVAGGVIGLYQTSGKKWTKQDFED